MGKFFGTDGVRGVANRDITPELAFALGRAGAYVLARKIVAPKILVAKDSRLSGDMLESALTAGLCSIGAQVHLAGVIPTPAVAHLVRKHNFAAGVMISASHNAMSDNGIKFFNSQGFKLPDEIEDEIEAIMEKNPPSNDKLPRPVGADVGAVKRAENAESEYIEFLLSTVPNLNLSGMKIALDCANGATSFAAPLALEKLGAEVITIHNTPNGMNINENCGSTHMESLAEKVRETRANIGIAFDGDGDRMLAVCEKGEMIDGDAILAVCGLDMRERGVLKKDTVVATVMSNKGFEIFCRDSKINMHRAAVGDRYVLEKMLAENYSLGGEQCGHIIFLDHNTTGDGPLTALQLLATMSRAKKPLSALAGVVETFPQVLVNARVANARKPEFETHPEIKKTQAEIESALGGAGRILVRPSGTEPLIRVMLEGRDKAQIEAWAKKLAEVIESCLEN
ncbi:MAG: phosphoglucosamine mutase [Defluviitaleaceae bacterium]|nr:phosphoglucosamine mutase [Defluviitaleaceae bacterium]